VASGLGHGVNVEVYYQFYWNKTRLPPVGTYFSVADILGKGRQPLFIDVDHFKGFNDTFGHEAGDQALQAVARTLTSTARSYDLYGRWGGEEFIGVIRNVDQQGLLAIAERCRTMVEHTLVEIESEQQQVTISIGAAVAGPGDDMPP